MKIPVVKSLSSLAKLTVEELFGIDEAQKAPFELYNSVGYLRRCVNIRGLVLANLPFEVIKGKDTVFWTPGVEAPAGWDFLSDFRRVLYLLETSMIMYGASFIIKEQEGARITKLQYVLPQTMREITDGDGEIVGFHRTAHTDETVRYQKFYVDDVIHCYDMSPTVEHGRPAPEILAATDSARVLFHLTDFIARYAQRGLIKGTVLTLDVERDEVVSDEEKSRIRYAFKRILDAFRNKANDLPEVLTKSVKPVTIGEGLQDLANTDITASAQETIASSLGVPHSLVMSNAANYMTASAEQVNMYEHTVLPRAAHIFDCLNDQLFQPRFGLRVVIRPERIAAFRTVAVERAKSAKELAGRPVITGNEARRLLGMEPLDDPAMDLLYEPTSPSLQIASKSLQTIPQQENNKQQKALGEMRLVLADIERKRWKRRVKRVGREVPFDIEYLTRSEAESIRTKLASGVEIENCFNQQENVL